MSQKNIGIYEQGLTFGTAPTAATYFGLRYYDNTGNLFGDLQFTAHSNGSNYSRLRCRNTNGTDTYDRMVQLYVKTDGTTQFIPNNSGVTELGASNYQWKTFNGINPGALSFPRTGTTANTDYIDVSGSIDLTTTANQTFTAPVTGWLCLSFSYNKVTSCQLSAGSYRSQTGSLGTNGYVGCTVPVTAGQTVSVRVDATAIYSARIFLCQGNV